MKDNTRVYLRKVLTEDDEEALRAYFVGHLDVVGGSRSPLGFILERLRLELPPVPPHGEMRDDEAARNELRRFYMVRDALVRIGRPMVEVLRLYYSPVPSQLVEGLSLAFGSAEVAAVAVSMVQVANGESQWAELDALRKRADEKTGEGTSRVHRYPGAKEELDQRKVRAKQAVMAAQEAFGRAVKDVRREMRSERLRRYERTMVLS